MSANLQDSVGVAWDATAGALIARSRAAVNARDPINTDDVSAGHIAGGFWYNETADTLFVCKDATLGAAVWAPYESGGDPWVALTQEQYDALVSAGTVDPEVLYIITGEPGELPAHTHAATEVTYDNTTSGLTATEVQAAIDEVASTAASAVQPGAPTSINAQVGTTYTLVLGDAGKLITCANASPVTVTVPADADVAYPNGTVIGVQQYGVGAITIMAAAGVTINGVTAGSHALTDEQYATTVALTKHAANTWTITGAVV